MRERVLIIDDDSDVRLLYRRLLTARGYRVLEATTVTEALAMAASRPDAIVLDLELPDGSGTAVLDALARDSEAPPVVVCTSSVYGWRVARRYRVAALGKFELTAIATEVARILRTGRRPRVSRSSCDSRPSIL